MFRPIGVNADPVLCFPIRPAPRTSGPVRMRASTVSATPAWAARLPDTRRRRTARPPVPGRDAAPSPECRRFSQDIVSCHATRFFCEAMRGVRETIRCTSPRIPQFFEAVDCIRWTLNWLRETPHTSPAAEHRPSNRPRLGRCCKSDRRWDSPLNTRSSRNRPNEPCCSRYIPTFWRPTSTEGSSMKRGRHSRSSQLARGRPAPT